MDHGDGMGGESWTPIASGPVSLPSGRNVPGRLVTFANSTAYKSYKMIFPTVKNAAATTQMQIAEIQFRGGPLVNFEFYAPIADRWLEEMLWPQ